MSTPEQELKRVLHYGLALQYYIPNDRLTNPYLTAAASKITELIESEKLSTEAANVILKAYSDGYSPYPYLLVHALVICVKQQKNKQLREAAYKAIKTVCSSPENMFLFLMFSKKYCQTAEGKSMWGSGFRKVMKEWYLKKDVKTLAEIVGKQKKCHGWSHKDIIKLIHLKTDEPARAAIIKYLLFGIKAAKKEYGENAEANEVLNFLQTVEDFKRLTDEQQAARSIEVHRFTLDHVPPHLMKSKEVWGALVGNLPLTTLLKSLERIAYLEFLQPNSLLVNKVVDALNDETAIAESHLHPAHVFITLRNYESSLKFIVAQNAKEARLGWIRRGDGKEVKTPPKPNPKIISALNDLFMSTCKLFLAPTGLKYLVAVDLKKATPSVNCYRCRTITVAQASAVTCLCLLHADTQNVAVCVAAANEELVPVALNTTMTLQQGVKKLEETPMQRMKLSMPIDWALKKKEEHDVFIVITDAIHKTDNNAVAALQKYREEMNKPNVKLILIFLRSHLVPIWIREKDAPGVFVIGGFDGHVPRLIEAFSRGAF